MPRNYIRKTNRQSWSTEHLQRAMTAVKNGDCSVKQAAKTYSVPRETLRRYLAKGDLEAKKKNLGRQPELGDELETVLAEHCKFLARHGFGLTRTQVRQLAYNFMKKLNINCDRFNQDNEMAGWDWLWGFLKRNPYLSVRKEETLSIGRALGMQKKFVEPFFKLLEEKILEHGLSNKPDRIFNADESGLQMNTRSQNVVCERGSKVVHCIAPKEKGETITVLACFNAAGNFYPPSLIFKGKRLRPEFSMNIPPGSQVYMSDSGYMNAEIFFKFIKSFIQYFGITTSARAILIIDGHDSHCVDPNMLEFSRDNGLCLLCLPPHTTHYLQPADRSLFKPLKDYFYRAASRFTRQHGGRAFSKIEFGAIFNEAWSASATVGVAVNGFRASGLWPVNIDAIPEYAFCNDNVTDEMAPSLRERHDDMESLIRPTSSILTPSANSNPIPSTSRDPIPSTSHYLNIAVEKDMSSNTKSIIDEISPLPKLNRPLATRGRKRGTARELTSGENIKLTRVKANNRDKKKSIPNSSKTIKQKFEDAKCPVCKKLFSGDHNGEEWVRCEVCSVWYHCKCVVVSSIKFVCVKCTTQ